MPWARLRCVKSRSYVVLLVLLVTALSVGCKKNPDAAGDGTVQPLASPSWEAGQRYDYRAKLASRVGLGSGEAMVELSLEGLLVIYARALEGGATQLAMSVQDAKLESPDQEARAQLTALAQELREPFVFSLASGKLDETFARSNSSRFADSIARTLAAAVQVAAQPQDGATTWKINEFDATGEYTAEYGRRGTTLELTKRKTKYESLALGTLSLTRAVATVTPKVEESQGQIVLTRNDNGQTRLQRVEMSERIEVQVTNTTPMKSATTLSLAFVQQKPEPFDWESALAHRSRYAAKERPPTDTEGPNYDANRIGDYTFERALRELEELARNPHQKALPTTDAEAPVPPDAAAEQESRLQRDSQAFTAAAALIRSEPKHIPVAVAKVRSGTPAQRALLDALGAAGTADAQQALIGLMDDVRLSKELRRAAAFSLIRTPTATPAAIEALQAHVGDDQLHVHAIYGLGTIARRLRERGDDAGATRLVKILVDNLAAAKSRQLRIHALRAIANAGHPSAFEAVRPWLDDSNEIVQAAAVDAVRLMDHPAVDGVLVDHVEKGSNPVVLSALDAISVRKPTPRLEGALIAAATGAEKASARIKAVRVLGSWLPTHPSLRATLEKVSRDDPMETVRKAAKQVLGA